MSARRRRVPAQPQRGSCTALRGCYPCRPLVPWTSWRDRPLYVQDGDHVTGRSVTAEQYGRFLIGVFEEWVRHDVGEVYVQMFDVALANWVGEPPGLCVHTETCGLALALEHTGDLYSCDHFVEPAYKLGNIKETPMLELVASQQQRQFGLDKRDTLPKYCLECDVRFACHGGCPKDRFIHTPDGEPGLNYLCAGYKAFFHHVDRPMRIMGQLLAQERAPSEIVQLYASQDARRGRNDPCTCALRMACVQIGLCARVALQRPGIWLAARPPPLATSLRRTVATSVGQWPTVTSKSL
jgi:radical SAM protein with 4Fe4S-binding SPASM domain